MLKTGVRKSIRKRGIISVRNWLVVSFSVGTMWLGIKFYLWSDYSYCTVSFWVRVRQFRIRIWLLIMSGLVLGLEAL